MERNIQKELEELKMMKQMTKLTEQERKDAIYIPLCLEMVALDYLHHLRLMMFVPGNAEAKWLGRVIEENIREYEKALNTKGIKLTEPMIARNAKRYDEALTGIMPRKFIFKADSLFTPFINAVSNGIKEVAPNGLEPFNGYEADTMAKAYFCYRLIHLALQAETQSVIMLTGKEDDFVLPQSITHIGASCLMIVEWLGGLKKKPTESKSTYVERVIKHSRAVEILDKFTYDATVKMIEQLEKIHIK